MGVFTFYLILLKLKPVQTLMKNNQRGGQSRKDATSTEKESIICTCISSVNLQFLTGLFKDGHELSALKPLNLLCVVFSLTIGKTVSKGACTCLGA